MKKIINYEKEPFTIYPFMFEEGLDWGSLLVLAIVYSFTINKVCYNRHKKYVCQLTGLNIDVVIVKFAELCKKGLIYKSGKTGGTFSYKAVIRKGSHK